MYFMAIFVARSKTVVPCINDETIRLRQHLGVQFLGQLLSRYILSFVTIWSFCTLWVALPLSLSLSLDRFNIYATSLTEALGFCLNAFMTGLWSWFLIENPFIFFHPFNSKSFIETINHTTHHDSELFLEVPMTEFRTTNSRRSFLDEVKFSREIMDYTEMLFDVGHS